MSVGYTNLMQIKELVLARNYKVVGKQEKDIKYPHEAYTRGELIDLFLTRLNKDREGTKYKPLEWRAVNGQLRNIKGRWDLLRFYNECANSAHFSKTFWWKLKQWKQSK